MSQAAASPAEAKPEEALSVALLLSLAGGYLDAYTFLRHDGVLANAQTANVVLLGVYAGIGEGAKALRHVPPILAFVAGLFVAWRLRHAGSAWIRRNLARLSLVVEIALLLVVMLVHTGLPDLAGVLGISFVAALQTASFARVEGWPYSSVMTTGNLRQSAEALFERLGGAGERTALRRAGVFGGISLAFAAGAALGAFFTLVLASAALAVPIALLLVVALQCRARPSSRTGPSRRRPVRRAASPFAPRPTAGARR